jgi:threonine dehydrogenase-like Zn-dependent dehydrogenase
MKPSEPMTAAVFKGEGLLALEERPVPTIRNPNDVLIAVKGVGVCGTDLHILEVPPRHPAAKDVIMGHEFCGQVLEVGSDVKNCRPGDHVAVDQNAGCGHCDECRRGYPNACLRRFNAPVPGFPNTPGIFCDGALARFAIISDQMAYRVNPDIPWYHLAITETVACAFNALQKASPEAGETAVVLGAGPVGLLLTSMLRHSGSRVITSEVSATRSAVANQLGAHLVVNPEEQDLPEIVKRETDGSGADLVIEAVGPLLNDCLELARFGGRVVLFGHDELAHPQVPQAVIMRKELQIFGVFLSKYTFVPAIRLLERKMLPLDVVVSHVMPLDRVFEAHDKVRTGDAIKIVIDPSM